MQYMTDELDIDCAGMKPESLLFSSGIIDSFSLVSLLSYIESSQGLKVSPAEVNLDNFDSLERMVAFIESKR
jgi:acyl carrier protein